jgi:hypothetical protein
MASIFQKSFASGEIAPPLYARCDLLKYATGLRTLKNMFVGRHGGAYNRPGTIYKSAASDSTHKIRLIPFKVPGSGGDYQLEFGHQYVRILQDGVPVQTSAKTIRAITAAASGVISFNEYHSMHVGDQITIAGVVGTMSALNGNSYFIQAVTSTTATIGADTTGLVYTSGGTATPVSPRDIKYTTIYTESVLRELTFAQEDVTLLIAHQSGFPMQFKYFAPEYWTITQDNSLVKPVIGTPTMYSGPTGRWYFVLSGSSSANSGATYTCAGATYTVVNTIASAGTLLQCTGSFQPPTSGTLTKASGTGDATISFTAISVYEGSTTFWGITAIAQDTYEESLIAVWGSSVAGTITLTWTPVAGAIEYNVYRGTQLNNLGFLAVAQQVATLGTYVDDQTTLKPDFTQPPPIERTIFANVGLGGAGSMLPAAVGYFQQRRFWGNMGPLVTSLGPPPIAPIYPNFADRIFGSRIGSTTYFNEQRPTPDDGQLSFRLIFKTPQTIRHFLDIGKLAVFTEQGEWILAGDQSSGGITPGTINPTNVSQNGSGFTPPLAIGSTALYVQYNSTLNTSIVRTFGFEFQIDGYRGDDVTIHSSHLTDGHQILSWTFQKLPHPIVWMARDDGVMLGMTLVPEQALLAWHRHDFTNGLIEDICSSGGNIYCVIKRTINGATVRYIEKFSSRAYSSILDAIFMDSAYTFDGRNTDSTKTMTLSGGSTWGYDETLTLTSSSSFFSGSSVGRFVHLRGPNDELVRFKITAYTSATVVSGRPDKTVPASMRNTGLSSWTDARTVITGLSHLEGQDVSILGDGFVIASPNNSLYPAMTVSGGQVTLSDGNTGYGVVHIGLPVTADLETLNIDNPQGPSMIGKQSSSQKSVFGLRRPAVYGQARALKTMMTILWPLSSSASMS